MTGLGGSEPSRERSGHDYSYALWGHAPVVAKGTIRGCPFGFRARWEGWTFTACLAGDGDPDLYDPPSDVDGTYDLGDGAFLYRQGTAARASYLPYDDVEAILATCFDAVRGALGGP
jgi:hypothetical protein